MRPLIDPRKGDFECDASSSKNRSMLSIAGSLLAEIGIPKLIVAWVALIGLPSLILGAMPIVTSIWISTTALKLDSLTFGLVPLLFLVLLAIVGILGGRRLFRIAERSFLALHSLAVQPVYAVCRELFNQVIDRMLPANVSPARRAAWRIFTTAASGIVICLLSIGILALAWPHVRVAVDASALSAPLTLVKAAWRTASHWFRLMSRLPPWFGLPPTRRHRQPVNSHGIRHRPPTIGPGALRICRTSMPSASDMDIVLRAVAPARKAMSVWRKSSPNWSKYIPRSLWMPCS